ncbi:MAG: T9SS type A sorting domain-containing protein [Hymenobacter sp.]|nr:MAG: T9SS type A sorting domain-containing protein [Hymenobacter sp.]
MKALFTNPLLTCAAAAGLLLARPAQAQWATNPMTNTTVRDVAGTSEVTPLSSPGPAGGTYVAWFESVATTNYQLRLQLLDVNGWPLFGAAGLLVSNQPQSTALFRYDLKTDNEGNAVLAFQDTRSAGGGNQCVLYKISPTGQQLWGATGIPLLDATATSGLSPSIGITATNNVVVGWNAGATATADHGTKLVPMLKFSPAGLALWSAPVRIQAASRRFSRPAFVAVPGTDDVVAEYVEETGSGLGVSTLFAQRYNASGAAVWAAPVQVSTKTIPFAFFPELVPDGSGGYFVQVNTGNPANANLNDVYVQRVAADGTLPWGTTGTEVLAGTATLRTSGSLQYVAARGEVWSVVNELDGTQSQSGTTVQRLSPTTGAVQLGAGGVVVQAPSATYYAAQTLRDTGTGLILTYSQTSYSINRSLWATKLNYQAQLAWAAGAVQLSNNVSAKLNYSTLPFANNQLVNVWADQRQDSGIYAQTINDSGQLGTLLGTRSGQAAGLLALSPNPSRSPVLHLSAARAQTVPITAHDLTGRLVWQAEVRLSAGATAMPLEAPALAAGIYLVEATVDGTAWRGRWVKP